MSAFPTRHPRRRLTQVVIPLLAAGLVAAACSGGGTTTAGVAPDASPVGTTQPPSPADSASGSPSASPSGGHGSRGHGAVVVPGSGTPAPGASAADATTDLYSHTRAGMLQQTVAKDPALVYVPNLSSDTVSVIDQSTLKVIRTLPVGNQPQHVVPSWDLRTLWVNNNTGARGNSLTPIDPATGQVSGPAVPVEDPYNLYFTPNGRSALVMAEANTDIDFRDPKSWRLQYRLHLGPRCAGVNHADFAPDGSYLIATCEFAGNLVKVDLRGTPSVVGYIDLNRPGAPAAPQDIKIDPFGKMWYVADMNTNGVHEIDGDAFTRVGFLPTGPETHGLYVSRDGTKLYVANRGGALVNQAPPFPHQGNQGSVSVVDFRSRKVVATWTIPGGGTPDMGNVSADGSRLWLSGRRSNEVYVLDTSDGRLVARIPVGLEPHGLSVWPQPGRFSLGHTGILR